MTKPKKKIDKELLTKIRETPCVVCGRSPCDVSHIRSRGAGAGWEAWEILPLCRSCHIKSHSMGTYRFALKHPAFMHALKIRGWEFDGTKLVRS